MKFSSRRSTSRQCRLFCVGLSSLCSLGLATSVSVAQTAALPAPALQSLRTLDLSREPMLKAPVSFEARRLPLREVLNDLQRQSGLKFGAEAPIDALRVTAHVEAMPLSQVLAALARLYGLEWSKSGAAYNLVASENAEFDLSLLQLGAPGSVEESAFLQSWKARKGIDWLGQITQFTSENELRSAQGVALSAVSPELMLRLRRPIELPAAARLVQAYARATTNNVEAGTLRIAVSNSGRGATTAFNLFDTDKKLLAPVIALSATPDTAR